MCVCQVYNVSILSNIARPYYSMYTHYIYAWLGLLYLLQGPLSHSPEHYQPY